MTWQEKLDEWQRSHSIVVPIPLEYRPPSPTVQGPEYADPVHPETLKQVEKKVAAIEEAIDLLWLW